MAFRVREAVEVLAISRSHFYELVAAGDIRVLKDGARTLIRRSELEAYLDRLEKASVAPMRRARRPLPNRS
jgi:excisionase family DNA binding protein